MTYNQETELSPRVDAMPKTDTVRNFGIYLCVLAPILWFFAAHYVGLE